MQTGCPGDQNTLCTSDRLESQWKTAWESDLLAKSNYSAFLVRLVLTIQKDLCQSVFTDTQTMLELGIKDQETRRLAQTTDQQSTQQQKYLRKDTTKFCGYSKTT